jgi:hypothetical protein
MGLYHRNHRQTRQGGNRGLRLGDRFASFADFRKIHGHCNVHRRYSEPQVRLVVVKRGVNTGCTYQVCISLFPVSGIGSMGSDRMGQPPPGCGSELADYCKIHGHSNVQDLQRSKAGYVVGTQEPLQVLEGKKSSMTLSRIQGGIGFQWNEATAPWKSV